MANMLGKRAQQRYGVGSRHCQCCSIDKVVREQKHSARQVEDRQWRKDADEMSPAQEQYELDAWYERIGCESDPWYELPPGFDGVWSTGDAHVLLMKKRHRMERVHESLRWLDMADEGRWYALEMVRLPQFERVVS